MKKRTKTRIAVITVFFLQFFTLYAFSQLHVLAVFPDKFGANTHLNLDNLEEYGFRITKAGMTATVQPCPWSAEIGNQPFVMDLVIDDIADITPYDVVIIMPMNWQVVSEPYEDLIVSDHFNDLLRNAKAQNKAKNI